MQFATRMSRFRFISLKSKFIKTFVLIKTYFPPLIIVGLVGDIVKEDIDIIVIQKSPREEFSIRKTRSSEKQGYVFKCKGKYLNLCE